MSSGAFPPVPLALVLVLVNEFAASTTEFLNRFVADCDVRISSISRRMDRLEMEVLVLEEKFEGEDGLAEPAGVAVVSVSVSQTAPPTAPTAAPTTAPTSPPNEREEKEGDAVLDKYLGMLRVGVPKPAVLLKMRANGHFDQYHAQLRE